MAKYRDKCGKDVVLRIESFVIRCFVSLIPVLMMGFIPVVLSTPTYAEAKASTISVDLTQEVMTFSVNPTPEGTFAKSPTTTIEVETDNFTGYTMVIKSSTASTSLEDTNNNEIQSISSAISESAFSSGSTYKNKWGYKPNQYVTSSNNVDTTVANTDYLPAPDNVTGTILAKTSTANVSEDTYTISSAAKVDTTLPAGTYTYTYVLQIVPNSITFNITYDDNTTDTVTNMPSPNPAAVNIDGGTPAVDSYATLSDAVPVRNSKKFAGWCDVATTTDQTTGDDVCSGTLYSAGDNLPLDQTDSPNITVYAVWVETLFPIVWNQMGACEFHGSGDGTGNDLPYNITGSECQKYWDVPFIDTEIPLYNATNASKDFEIHFKIDRYVISEQVDNDNQQTFVNAKVSSTATSSTIASGEAPGLIVRRSSNNIEFNSKIDDKQVRPVVSANSIVSGGGEVSVFRLNNKIYYSVDRGPLVLVQDITGFDQYFGLTTWFGAYPSDGCTGDNGLCTNAKRFIEATLSDMYIKLGEYSDEDVHTINFKKNDGTTDNEASYLIEDGNSITTLPEAPTYSNHLFQGWFTAQSGGTQVTTSTIPVASADYYAHWLGTVVVADIDNPVIALSPNETETIVVNNASELEPYTFSSSNNNVATVNQTTGEITAIGPGSATITMCGSTSGETKTISVTVAGQVIHVTFDSQGGTPASYTWDVGDGSSFTTLPAPTKQDYDFAGWYTGIDGAGDELTTSTIFNSNTPTQYYAKWEEAAFVCKIAKQLHTETCGWSSSNGCKNAGFDYGDTITYGNLVESTTMNYGDAYNCDINYDKTWSESNERFYYIGSNNGVASFVFYNNVPDVNLNYTDAMNSIPNTSPDNDDWINPGLQTIGSKVTRFMTVAEVTEICNGTSNIGTKISGTDKGRCGYIAENSSYAYETGKLDTIWLQQVNGANRRIHLKSGRNIASPAATSINGPRVVIEVPLSLVEPYVPTPTYEITFDPHNETQSWTETIDQGDDLSEVYPATDPTYTNHIFQGWFTAATDGSQISSSTEPSADTTYHAQWLKTVALATLESDNFTIEEGNTATINVTNSSELEAYSFTPVDSSVVTVTSAGVITAVSEGTTTINMVGTTSGAIKTISVTVTAPVLTTVCQLATTGTLHTATNADSVSVEYGQIANNATPQPGDAYNCDVDYDGTYSAVNERFYYLGQDGSNNAVLVAWNNYQGNAWGPTDNTASTYTYANSIAQLPGNGAGEWDNPGLIEQETGKAARHMYYSEVVSACGNINVTTANALEACNYLMEHTAYDNAGRSALWLMLEGSTYRRIHAGTGNRHVAGSNASATSTVRPAIVVPYNLIEKYTPVLLDVTHAIIANNDLTTTVGGQFTITVSNSAELEPYTFSSANTSIATVDSSGVITGVSAGTTDIIMTGTTSGLTKTLEVEITAAQTIFHTVTFNPNGGSFSDPSDSSKQVADGTAVGTLPTPTKANHMFFGWYKDDGTLYQEVYPEETIDDNVTYYAKWVESTSSFPIVWAETNACTFNGSSNLTGDYCLEDAVSGNSIDKTKHYIDTAVQLFTQANFQKDFEVGLNIVSFNDSSSTSQATFVTSKAENLSGWPGFTLRRATTTGNLEFTERFSMNSQAVSAPLVAISSVNRVKIARIGEKIYYSWNDAPYTLLQDISANTTRFDTKVWFGATLNSAGTGSQRPIYATFTDMYIRLGVPTDYVIELDVNGGTMSDPSSFTVPIDSQLGTLPTPTPPNENYTFVGWFDESVSPAVQVTSTTVPDGDKKYVAHYAYDSSDEPVIFNIANDALQGYQTLINSWVPSPISITTFNQSSPINDSTWGDTSELSEKQFWEGIKGNFENNLCSIPSYSDSVKPLSSLTAWGNGSVDCSKPRAYDTKIGAALNVYLNDENGAQVAYANATNGIIHNMIPGQTYYWEKADDSTVYGYVTATSVSGRRMIEFSGNRNTRDLGGLPVTYTDSNNQTVTGTVAYGRLFRGERLWSTPKQEFYNLGINKQYDVGDPTEYANDTKLDEYKWDPVVHYNFDYHTGDENNASSNYMKAWTAVTDIMTDITSANDPKNIYFHCRVGSDRTGTTAYLLEGLLGVPDEARYEEYELSNLSGMYDRTRYYKQKSSTNNLKFVFMMEYVKTNTDILNWYMSNPNSDMDLVQAFRSAMTVTGGSGGGSGQQGTNNTPANTNSISPLSNRMAASSDTESNQTNNAISQSMMNSGASDSSYAAPLGVSETSDASSNIGLIVAGLGAVASGVGASYALAKQDDEKA